MKYIDADRLRKEIERLRVWLKSDEAAPFVEAYLIGGEKALNSIEDFLDSLQQEQPNKESLNESQQEFVASLSAMRMRRLSTLWKVAKSPSKLKK